jgi:hypothetical protein
VTVFSSTDPATGNKTVTQFVLGVLPFSSYFLGEFVLDQKLATFIGVHPIKFEGNKLTAV